MAQLSTLGRFALLLPMNSPMDKHTLTIIVITAVVSTVVSKLVSWFVKRTAKVATTAKFAVIRYWRVIDIINEGVLALFWFGLAFWTCLPGRPITGVTVFLIALFVGLGFRGISDTEEKLLIYEIEKRLPKKRDPSA